MNEPKYTCPTSKHPLKGCGSSNVGKSGDGLLDCGDCGLFFSEWEGLGLVEVQFFLPDGTDTVAYVTPDSPLAGASWSAHATPCKTSAPP